MKFTRILALLLALVLVMPATFGCSSGNGNKIKIGVIAPLTGNVAVYGNAVNDAVKLYVDQFNKAGGINGAKIELITYDDKGDATEALTAYNKLISSDNVVAVIGSVTSTPTLGIAEQSAKDNVPVITGTATHPDVTTYGKNLFRACFLDSRQGEAITTFATDYLKAKTGAIIYNTSDSYSTGLKDSITADAEKLGLTISATEGYANGDIDFNSQLTNIITTKPEILFIPDYYNNAYLICKQARQLGFTGTFLGVDGTDGILDIEGVDNSFIDGMYFANHYAADKNDPTVLQFVKDYKELYNATPNALAALGYDAAKIMINAIAAVINSHASDTDANGAAVAYTISNSAEDRQAIIDALAATDLDCVTGHITFDENRNPIKDCVIIQIKDGANHFVANY